MKKVLSAICSFLKKHTIVAVILIFAIFLTCLWTPAIIVLSKKSKDNNSSLETLNSSASQGSSVFNAGEKSNTDSEKNTGKTQTGGQTKVESNIQSSNKQESNTTQSKDQTVSSTGNKKTPINKKRIICWGDSITVGMSMEKTKTYPAVLGSLLGEGYTVINAGGGGETAKTIAARQGAYKVYTAKELVFNEEDLYIDMGSDNSHTFCLEDGTMINLDVYPNPFSPYEFTSNTIFINGQEYNLPKDGKSFRIRRLNDFGKKTVIPKGSEVVFESAIEQAKGSYCEIFYIGTNGRILGVPTQEDIDFLVEQNKKMIERHGNDCYLVIIPYWDGYYSEAFIKAFGDKAVDFRKELLENGFSEEGLYPTVEDNEKMKQGIIPPSFRLKNNPNDIHLNEYGYSFLAKKLYERGQKLGYWE